MHWHIAINMDERFLLMAEQGNSILVRKLLKAKVVDINAKDEMRMTALAKACKGTYISISKWADGHEVLFMLLQ